MTRNFILSDGYSTLGYPQEYGLGRGRIRQTAAFDMKTRLHGNIDKPRE